MRNWLKELEDAFSYHDVTEEHAAQMREIRRALFRVGVLILEHCPEVPDRTLAINKLKEARNFANSAIASQDPVKEGPYDDPV